MQQGSAEFAVGEVLGTAARLLVRKAGVFVALSLIGAVPMLAVMAFVLVSILSAQGLGMAELVGLVALLVVVSLASFAWSQAAIVYYGVRTLRAEPPTIGQAARQALLKVAPVAAVLLLANLAIALGFLLLLVPGVVLLLMFWVAVPAAVVEGGVVSALRRSHQLTKGHKWPILGLLFVLMLALWIVSAVAAIISEFASVTDLGIGSALLLGAALILQLLAWAVWGVAGAAGYYQLRLVAEGEAGGATPEVFR